MDIDGSLSQEDEPSTSFEVFSQCQGSSRVVKREGFQISEESGAVLPIVEAYMFKDDNQASHVMGHLADFRDSMEMCDIELIAEGKSLKAHRCVIAAGIPYFRSMFTCGMVESNKTTITINDISYDSLRLLVEYVYTSTIRIDSENVQNLLFAAAILQMDAVCMACQKFLTRFLTMVNCLSIRQFAQRHNCVELLSSSDDFAAGHFSEVRNLEEFNHIGFDHLCDLLKRDDLLVKNEEQMFETIMSWVEFSRTDRLQYLASALSLVRLPQLPMSFLCEVVRPHPHIVNSPKCLEMVSNALFEMLLPLKGSTSSIATAIMDEGGAQYAAGSSLSMSYPLSIETMGTLSRPRNSVAGVIFCAGGRGTVGDPFRSVEAFDLRKRRWVPVDSMTTQRRHVGVVSCYGKLYAIGGHDGLSHLDTTEVFDPVIGHWRRVASMNTSRRGIAVAALEGAIYAVGGLDDSTCFPTVERYDVELDDWAEVAKMKIQRGGVGVAALGKSLLAIGGNDGQSSLDSCERFDPVLNRWKLIANMNNRRAGAGVCVLDGYLYAVGGFDDNAPLATCERYDARADQWTPLANMSCARGGVGVAAMAGLVYAIGGHDGHRYLKTVEAFDPTTNTWSPVVSIRECRAGAGVAWADCRMEDVLRPMIQDSGCAPSGNNQCI